MTFGDFSSLVQLGVGLHAGTALFQLLTEFGVAPLERRVLRLDEYITNAAPDQKGEIDELKTQLTIFKIQSFNEYKKFVLFNFVIALLLVGALIAISFLYTSSIHWVLAVIFSGFSILPAIITMHLHWSKASQPLSALQRRVEKVEHRLFPSSRKKIGEAKPI